MRLDALAGTVRDVEVGHVVDALRHSLGGVVTVGPRLARYGGQTWAIDVDGRMAVWVGLDVYNRTVFFEGKGVTSPALAKAANVYFPGYSVARADVCEDYDEPGVFHKLRDLVRRHKGSKVKGAYVALPDDADDGATWQAGARGGVALVRVYEAGKHPSRRHLARPDWSRIEGEFRPHYAADKRAAATFAPLDFWGLSAWTQRVGEALTTCEVPRYVGQAHEWTHGKTKTYLARQFRRFWVEELADGRDWTCIGREFQAIWEEDDHAAALLRKRGEA